MTSPDYGQHRAVDTWTVTRILCPVVVGRDNELAALDNAIEAARAGCGGVMVVAGPPGIGKSRLAAQASATARQRGMKVFIGRCVPAEIPVPYRPIAEALSESKEDEAFLENSASGGVQRTLSYVLPWHPRPSQERQAEASPIVVAAAVLGAMRTAAQSSGAVLIIEDLQWADPETRHAIEYLADHANSAAVLCLCTLRDDADTAATDLVGRLDSRRAAEVLSLKPLTPKQVVEMGATALGVAHIPPSVEQLLDESADGVPLLVEELLPAQRRAAHWCVPPAGGRLPPRLGDSSRTASPQPSRHACSHSDPTAAGCSAPRRCSDEASTGSWPRSQPASMSR
jgi:predicted ATPase